MRIGTQSHDLGAARKLNDPADLIEACCRFHRNPRLAGLGHVDVWIVLWEDDDDVQSDHVLRELLGPTWIACGDDTADEWRNVMGEIGDVRDKQKSDYLLGTSLLADYPEEGMSLFGHSCHEFGGKG